MFEKSRTSREPDESLGWWHTIETSVLCLFYVTAFWGEAGRLLPAPLDQWYALFYRAIGPWWREHVATGLSNREQGALYQLVESLFLAVLLPVWILYRRGRTLRSAGVCLTHRTALRPAIAGILLSLPIGLYLSRVVPNPWGSPLQEALGLITVIPEHFLIFGVVGALLLPHGHSTAAQRQSQLGSRRIFVVTTTAALFGLIHVGVEPRSVLIAAFPLGAIFADVTVRTGSIWPAIGAHWIMNVIPMTWDVLSR